MKTNTMGRKQLESFCENYEHVHGYDDLRDYLYKHCEEMGFDHSAWTVYHSLMVAY